MIATTLDRTSAVKAKIVRQQSQEYQMERRWRDTLVKDSEAWATVETLTTDLELVEHHAGAREQLEAMIEEFQRASDWSEFQILVLRVCAEDGCREDEGGLVRSVAYVEGRQMARRWLIAQVQTGSKS